MSLNKYLHIASNLRENLDKDFYRIYLKDRLLSIMPNIEGFKKTTIINEFTSIYGNQYKNIAESVILEYYNAKKLLSNYNNIVLRNSIFVNFACDLYKSEFKTSKIDIICKLLLFSIITDGSFEKLLNDVKTVSNLSDDESYKISSLLYSIYMRRRTIYSGNIAEVFRYEFMCQKHKYHNFCSHYYDKSLHVNKIMMLKNDDEMSPMFWGGSFNCSGNWLANPFRS
ncbi:hypothetical protein MNBD_IGNAVI01-2569 [hydrothermal vent metagenome]|uniref:Uncharacterized protein n=1 Tax=hydrothermal vent metagenome TaxID=652676 RepID=A0A3B1CN83_9ZZZZ